MIKPRKPYEPTPGTIPYLVIQHLQTLEPGGKLSTAALMEAIGQPETKAVKAYMEGAIRHGLVKTERIPNSRHLLWTLGDGTPPDIESGEGLAGDDDTTDLAGPKPTPNLAAASVFALAGQGAAPAGQVQEHEPQSTRADDFRCALFNDGTLFIRSNGAEHTLPTAHTRLLLSYLDALKPGDLDA